MRQKKSNAFYGGFTMMYNEYSLHNRNEPPDIPANMGIDKIGILVHNSILERLSSPKLLKDKIEIITHGNYSRLIFQGEYINQSAPLYSIAHLLMIAINYGVFKQEFAQYLYWHCYNILCLNGNPLYFVNGLFINGPFKWNELEIYFDIYGNILPFQITRLSLFYKNASTFYSRDYENIRRTVYRNDGSWYKESKGKHRSLLAIYDRGKRLDSVYPNISHGDITRIEIRICDIKAKSILNPHDMRLPLEGFIEMNSDKILGKFNQCILSDDAIMFDKIFIEDKLPYLPYLIPCSLQRNCLSSKRELFS
jgi:hypothetical protein